MQNAIVPDYERVSPFSEQDKIDHLGKFFERTFGFPASEVGTIEAHGTGALLKTIGASGPHTFGYARQSNGVLAWFMDMSDEPIAFRPARVGQQMRELAAS